MTKMNVAFINHSTAITDDEVKIIMAAIQIQADRDFTPAYGTSALLSFYEKKTQVPPDFSQLVFLDNSDQAGALGYHELTASGRPLSKIFVKTDLQYGLHVSVTASHEFCEMLADPLAAMTVFVQYTNNDPGKFYFYEVCDAVEDDSLAYSIETPAKPILVSDFVLPNWFNIEAKGPYDFKNYVHKPLHLLKGGYIGVFDVRTVQFTELSNMEKSPRMLTRAVDKGHRSDLRMIAPSERRCSLI